MVDVYAYWLPAAGPRFTRGERAKHSCGYVGAAYIAVEANDHSQTA